MTVTAIVAARGGSVRLPGKALLPWGDTTLIGHKVRQLRRCRTIDRVVVNSDSPAIAAAAVAEGAEPIEGRDYAGDTHEMLADSCRQVADGVVVWAHPTNPLVTPATYVRALAAYQSALTVGYDSLCSVYRVQRHAWYTGKPLNYDPWTSPHPLAAETEPVWFQDGAIFIQTREAFLRTRYFFGANPLLFETPAEEVGDIDTHSDYACCRSSSRPVARFAVTTPVG